MESITSERQGFGQKDAMVKSTVISRLELILHALGQTITTESDILQHLAESHCIISTTGLMTEIESWLTEGILLWESTRRVHNPDQRELAARIYDECQHRLFSSEKELKVQKIGASVISKLVDEARGLNIGICSLAQEPSTLIKGVLNNSWLKVAFHLGSGTEIKVMKDAMGLTAEQADMLHYLETGEAIARMAGGYMDAFPVKFDEFNPLPCMSQHEFRKHQQQMKADLYKKTVPTNASQVQVPDNDFTNRTQSTTQCNPISSSSPKKRGDNKSSPSRTRVSPHQSESSTELKRVLAVWLNLEEPELSQGEIFDRVGISSGSRQDKIKKDLLKQGYIRENWLQVGKRRLCIWEPTDKAFLAIGIDRKGWGGFKGSFLHRLCVRKTKEWGKAHGYEVKSEFRLSNNKPVDLVLQKPGETLFIEAAVSKPWEKEISNVLRDFTSDLQPDRLIILAMDSKAEKELKSLIDSDERTAPFRDKIQVVLAGQFVQT